MGRDQPGLGPDGPRVLREGALLAGAGRGVHRQLVDEEADLVALLRTPGGERDGHRHGLTAVAVQQAVQGGEQELEDGDPAVARGIHQGGAGGAVEPPGDGLAAAGVGGGPGAVGQYRVGGRGPARAVELGRPADEGGVGGQVVPTGGVEGQVVLAGRLGGQVVPTGGGAGDGRFAGARGGVGGGEVGRQHVLGVAVEHRVVGHHQQVRRPVGPPVQGEAGERSGREVEGEGEFLGQPLGERLAGVGRGVDEGEGGRPLGGDEPDESALLDQGGRERGVAGDGGGDGPRQGVGVDPVEAVEPEPQGEVEGLGDGGPPAGQPDPVLGGGRGAPGAGRGGRRSRGLLRSGGRAGHGGGVGHGGLDSGDGGGAVGHRSERVLPQRRGPVDGAAAAWGPARPSGRSAGRRSKADPTPRFPLMGQAVRSSPRGKIIGLDLPRDFHRPHASSRVVHDRVGAVRRFVNYLPVPGCPGPVKNLSGARTGSMAGAAAGPGVGPAAAVAKLSVQLWVHCPSSKRHRTGPLPSISGAYT